MVETSSGLVELMVETSSGIPSGVNSPPLNNEELGIYIVRSAPPELKDKFKPESILKLKELIPSSSGVSSEIVSSEKD